MTRRQRNTECNGDDVHGLRAAFTTTASFSFSAGGLDRKLNGDPRAGFSVICNYMPVVFEQLDNVTYIDKLYGILY